MAHDVDERNVAYEKIYSLSGNSLSLFTCTLLGTDSELKLYSADMS